MEPSQLLEEATVYIGRWSSGHTYVTMTEVLGLGEPAAIQSFGFAPGASNDDVVVNVALVLKAWAQWGPLGVTLAIERLQRDGLIG